MQLGRTANRLGKEDGGSGYPSWWAPQGRPPAPPRGVRPTPPPHRSSVQTATAAASPSADRRRPCGSRACPLPVAAGAASAAVCEAARRGRPSRHHPPDIPPTPPARPPRAVAAAPGADPSTGGRPGREEVEKEQATKWGGEGARTDPAARRPFPPAPAVDVTAPWGHACVHEGTDEGRPPPPLQVARWVHRGKLGDRGGRQHGGTGAGEWGMRGGWVMGGKVRSRGERWRRDSWKKIE